jgi:hypothetical protein
MGIRLRCCLFLIVYEIWIGEAAKLAKAAGGNTLCTQNTMLVRTCRMGNLPIRLHVRTDGWYTGLVGRKR